MKIIMIITKKSDDDTVSFVFSLTQIGCQLKEMKKILFYK